MIIKQDYLTKASRLGSVITRCALVCAIGLSIVSPVRAGAESVRFEIASQPLSTALHAFAEQAHMQLLYEHATVTGAMSNAVSGEFDKRAALEQLLLGTGLEVVFSSNNAATIRLAYASPGKDIIKAQNAKPTEKDIEPAQFDSLSAGGK